MFSTFFLFFFGLTVQLMRYQFPDQGSNQCPLQWKRRVLTTRPSGNSLLISKCILYLKILNTLKSGGSSTTTFACHVSYLWCFCLLFNLLNKAIQPSRAINRNSKRELQKIRQSILATDLFLQRLCWYLQKGDLRLDVPSCVILTL